MVNEKIKSKRQRKLEGDIGKFVQQYARKAEAGHDPNDRPYSREVEKVVKRMKPEELDALSAAKFQFRAFPVLRITLTRLANEVQSALI